MKINRLLLLFEFALFLFSPLLPTKEIGIVNESYVIIHSDHNAQSAVVGSAPIESLAKQAVWNIGDDCWEAVKYDGVLRWVDTNQLQNRDQLCWDLNSIPASAPVCIQDGKYSTCVK